MRAIDELDGEFRIRLSSIEATEVTRELIDVIGEMGERICPHLHVCLQSGSNRVLRRMRRRWGVKMFVDRCQMLRDAFDEPALTTDVIVGFPGETEAEFAETVETVRKVGFSKIHTFPFSARQDTPAADLPGQLSKAVKSERSRALTEVEHELRDAYYQRLIGRPLQVLIESTSDSDELATGDPHVVGTSCRYAPVATRGDESLVGKLLTVTPTRLADDRLVCGM
jgi:threonylcarbamoyladenosine tRNA methylthiotransferase MtaB